MYIELQNIVCVCMCYYVNCINSEAVKLKNKQKRENEKKSRGKNRCLMSRFLIMTADEMSSDVTLKAGNKKRI